MLQLLSLNYWIGYGSNHSNYPCEGSMRNLSMEELKGVTVPSLMSLGLSPENFPGALMMMALAKKRVLEL